ncbi:neural-cadherin-like isoform X1 [Macrobrachium rosenbergii]|uniref:neural-cadherin-like isoform X1 n=1 Tax=Macrobrachium rosenbergii TaxID=79674 RepID=UPI0034D77812
MSPVSISNCIINKCRSRNSLLKSRSNVRSESRGSFQAKTLRLGTSSVFWNWLCVGWITAMAANVLLPILFPLSDELDYPNVTKFLRIGLADKNDHPPFFEQSLYEVELLEDQAVNQTLLTLTANDLDEVSRMHYEIIEGNEEKTFAIGKLSGELYLTQPLDYETRRKYDLGLLVSDGRHESDTRLIIHVLDVNDNPPLFDRHLYETRITEEVDKGLPKHILTVTVTDGDYDRPQNVVFSLSGQGIDVENPENSHFHIVPSTGEVFVRKPLDRDYPGGRPSWGLTVFAQDEGGTGLVGYSEIVVNLKDINDNPPVFSEELYYGNITENGSYGQEVIAMAADDYDDPKEGTNAQLSYSIEKNVIHEVTAKPIFMIEPETGVVRTAVCCLDREKTSSYTIQVVAMDGGGLKGTGTVSIQVQDINDRPPRFTKDEWVIETDETDSLSLPTEPILTVTVYDEDENNTFAYKVIDSSGYGADKFEMLTNDDGTGSLVVVKPLDFEDPRQAHGFRFQIQVSDTGDDDFPESYHTAKSWVKVRLKDINDNNPHFIRHTSEVQVLENVQVGKNIVQIKARDFDKGGKSKISYLIERLSDKHRHFHIDESGLVTVQRALDREANPKHVVKVLAVDDGFPARTSTATLTVSVLDVNDNAPKVSSSYQPVLPENTPPRKFAEILATDADDPLKNNGPPFHFSLSSEASNEIKSSFKVDSVPDGADGKGMAVISSLREFDREVQKEYYVPIVVADSGEPPMIGTSTITVIIGDDNDNIMKSGTKDVLFYSYKGRAHDTQIGNVYVWDPDDWDVEDKKFTWVRHPHPNFRLDEETGMLTLKYAASETSYHLKFNVHDNRHLQSNIEAKVTVKVKHIDDTAIQNAGSIRIQGIGETEFIGKWNYRKREYMKSVADNFKENLAEILGVSLNDVHLFSIQLKQSKPPVTDVFFSVFDSEYLSSVEINGLLLMHKKEIERRLSLNIIMVGINECFYENLHCDGSCTSKLEVLKPHHLIDANSTSFVGLQTKVIPECVCGARDFSTEESCRPNPCYNNGQCIEEESSVYCLCPDGYDGPRCQMLSRTFSGNGFVWLPPLQTCESSHLSVEFLTTDPEGLIFYNGPLLSPEKNKNFVTDFIALEIVNGKLRLLINFGSGTLLLGVNNSEPLNDGRWHRADIFWDKEEARLDLDYCMDVKLSETESNMEEAADFSVCQSRGRLPPFNEYLNINTPLQVGGLAHTTFFKTMFRNNNNVPAGKPFQGCIKNLIMNSQFYDFAHPGLQRNSEAGCSQFTKLCNNNATVVGCGTNGICDGSIHEPVCLCHPGWTGLYCDESTVPSYFEENSYIKYSLSFKPNPFHTSFQLRFRTWEENGELFRISDLLEQEYGILEIQDSHLQFRYNLDSVSLTEEVLCLSSIFVNNGEWHDVKILRYGSVAIIALDGGEGRKYNETSKFFGHMFMDIDKQEGVFAGGQAEYSNVNIFTVHNDYKFGCIDDLRLEGKTLPLPPSLSGTQWAQATVIHNISSECTSPSQCLNITCIAPLICKDLWMKHECGCPEGTLLSKDNRVCLDHDECLSSPCKNGGICHNLQPSYICQCSHGYTGPNCELTQDISTLNPSMPALAAVVVCVIIIFALVFVIIFCLRRKRQRSPKDNTSNMKQETTVKYKEKGDGEGEVTILDLTALPAPNVVTNGGNFIPRIVQDKSSSSGITSVDVVVCKREGKKSVTLQKPPNWEDLRNYAYEGGGSTASSLSSLGSGTDSGEQSFEYLASWGPCFLRLAALYAECDSEEDDEERARDPS